MKTTLQKTEQTQNHLLLALLLAGAYIWALRADAGQEGHGGNAVVCFSDTTTAEEILRQPGGKSMIPDSALPRIASIQTLDLYEAERMGSLEGGSEKAVLLQPESGETHRNYLQRIQSRFEYTVPRLGHEIQTGIDRLLNRITVYGTEKESSGIAQAFDLGSLPYVIDTEHCVIATVARQWGSRAAGTIRVAIDGRLMNHPMHSDLSRKTLLLHEVLYAWALEKGDTDSEATRFLVTKLLKKELSRQDVIDALVGYGFVNQGDTELFGETFYQLDVEREIRKAVEPLFLLMGGKSYAEFERSPEIQMPYERMNDLKSELAELNSEIYDLDLKIRQESRAELREKWTAMKAEKHRDREKKTTEFTWYAQQVQTLDARKVKILDAFKAARAGFVQWVRLTLVPKHLNPFAQGSCFKSESSRQRYEDRVTLGFEDYFGLTPDPIRPLYDVRTLAPVCDGFLIRS